MLITRRVTNKKELEEIFRERYRIFVERDREWVGRSYEIDYYRKPECKAKRTYT